MIEFRKFSHPFAVPHIFTHSLEKRCRGIYIYSGQPVKFPTTFVKIRKLKDPLLFAQVWFTYFQNDGAKPLSRCRVGRWAWRWAWKGWPDRSPGPASDPGSPDLTEQTECIISLVLVPKRPQQIIVCSLNLDCWDPVAPPRNKCNYLKNDTYLWT